MNKFPFEAPENQATIICTHVANDGKDILYISHDEDDGGWQFLCDSEHNDASEGMVVSLSYPYELDNTVGEVADMPEGFYATRKDKKSNWFISKY